jgi:putative serine protease PepD
MTTMTDARHEPDNTDDAAESGEAVAPSQYPQYVAPQGFSSPHGTQPFEPSAQPFEPSAPPSTQPFPPSAQPPPSSASWRADLDPTTPYPAQPQFGQPPGSGWSTGPGLNPAARPASRGRGALVVLVVGGSLLAGAIGGVAGGALYDDVSSSSSGRNPTISLPQPAPVDPNRPVGSVTAVADKVLPSVVSIKVKTSTEGGTGSGFVIDAAGGYILTNNHVVTAGGSATASSIKVIFQDGTQVAGKVVGRDASYDLAVLKVKAKGLRALQLGDSDAVRVGDPVVAIGAPLGLQGTVTTGIVSALNRPVAAGEGDKPAFINAIQTDAAINPGNSGGPLVDSSGRVIAVNSAIAKAPDSTGSTSGNIGLGFAIPSNQARRTALELIHTGHAEHPIIGVSLDPSYDGEGVKVSDQPNAAGDPPVTQGGPADQAGIRPGDVITKINGRVVTATDELIVAIRAQAPGTTVTLTVRRGSSLKEVRVKLSAVSD